MFDSISTGWLFAGGAALVTIVATCWSHLQSLYQQLSSRVVMRVTVSGYQADAIQYYLKREFKASTWGPRSYLAWMLYVRPRQRVQLVSLEVTPPSGRIYWRRWRPLWACRSKERPEDLEVGVNAQDYDYECISLCFLRGTFNPDRLVVEATDRFNEQIIERTDTDGRRHYIRHVYGTAGKPSGIVVGNVANQPTTPSSNTDIRACLPHRSLAWTFSQLGPDKSTSGAAVDELALCRDAMDIVEEAQRWKESEQWHKARGIPWRRGWLLHGMPGTGKTALARAIAEDLDLPVFAYDLASLHNNELQQEWIKMLSEVPCMALIEDIDAIFELRQNVSGRDRQHLTFDCLLNCLDGVERADGLLVVITTNRLEKVDDALGAPSDGTGSTRPGRIDRIVEMDLPDSDGRRKIARRILQDWPEFQVDIIAAGEGDTGAQFQERCTRRALQLHFDPESIYELIDCHGSTAYNL